MRGPILVTGATGLIGRELVPALRSAGHQVVATSRSSSRVDEPGRDLSVSALARDLVERRRPAVVVHLAGGTAPDRGQLYRANVLTTVHLLEGSAALPKPPYFVVLGSAAEYGEGTGEPLSEDSPLRPVSDYGRAKAAQTAVAEELAGRLGIPLTVLRPFNLVSAELPATTALGHLRQLLLDSTDDEPAVPCGRLDVIRDYVAVGAVVEAVSRLVERPLAGHTINVCSGVGLELGSILAAMARRLDRKPRVIVDPELAALPAAPRVVGDPSSMKALLGLELGATPDSVARLVLGR